jgi:hypothetical protein
VHALVTREAGYLAYVAPLSVVFGMRDATGHVSPPEPSSVGQRELSFVGHAVAPEALQEGRPYSGLFGMWPLWSCPVRGGNP